MAVSIVMPATASARSAADDGLRQAIQYAAACRFKHQCLWNTGSRGPVFAKGFDEAGLEGTPEL